MIDKTSAIPLYIQIKDDIKDKILEHVYGVGEKIPAETDLMRMYNVSRMTVRNAIACLDHEGLIKKSQGHGTYVRNSKSIQEMNKITSWTETMKTQGYKVRNKLLNAECIQADVDTATLLEVDVGARVYLIERLRYCNDIPITYVKNYILIFAVGDDFLDVIRENCNSLYTMMEKRYRVVYSMAKEMIGARAANTAEAKLLNIYRGFPIITNTRLDYNDRGEPFEMDISFTRSDRYELTVTMRGRK